MNSTQLKVFHAVARAGSFSAAAHRLSLTQPAISDHIRKLEEAHGTQLFVRGPRGATLTDIGRKLLSITERLTEAEQEARDLLTRAGGLEEGELTIGADAATHVLAAVKRFHGRFPGIHVRLVSGNSADLLVKLRSFAIDFAVLAGKPEGTDLGLHPLRNDAMVAIAGAGTALAGRRAVSLAELARHRFVMRETGSVTRAMLEHALKAEGLAVDTALEVDGREACLEAVAQGIGVAVVSKGEINADARIRAIAISNHVERMEETLVFLRARTSLRLVQAFLECVD